MDGAAGGSGIVIVRYLTGTIGYGILYLGSSNTSSADLAEYYVAGDKDIEAGDVVTISNTRVIARREATKQSLEITSPSERSRDDITTVDTKGVLRKATKAYDSKLIGIISTSPGLLMGSIDGDTGKKDKRMLALAGRVPVKIDPDSDPIEVGDFLTSSDTQGLAKKATRSGYVVGRALESWKSCANQAPESGAHQGCGAPAIEAFISLSYYMGDVDEHGDLQTFIVNSLKGEFSENRYASCNEVNVMDINIRQAEIDGKKPCTYSLVDGKEFDCIGNTFIGRLRIHSYVDTIVSIW